MSSLIASSRDLESMRLTLDFFQSKTEKISIIDVEQDMELF